ncbi:MAG: hypothetical protein ABI175_09745 [Polyangiales bacterium]
MSDLEALPELQQLVDRLAATIDDNDLIAHRSPSDWPRVGRVVDAALADARRIVPIVDHVTNDIDAGNARSLRSGIAPWLGDLAGVLYASGRAHEATQLLMTAERFTEGDEKKKVFVAARRDPRSFVVLCQAHRLVRRDRFEEAEALVEATLPTVADPDLADVFRAF